MLLSPSVSMNVFWFEFVILYLNIDSTINILCVNLQYSYAIPLYQRLKCYKLEKATKKCIVKCYNFDKKCCKFTCLGKKSTKSKQIFDDQTENTVSVV